MDLETDRLQIILRRFVVGSFIVEMILAESWLRIARQSSITKLLSLQGLSFSVALGLGLALVLALSSRIYFTRFTPQLIRELFIPIFGRVSGSNILLISLLPGLGEEVLFRGVIQPELGVAGASVIFGLMHSGLSRRLLPYGVWSALVGLVLGLLYLATGNIWGAVAAHSLINALGALWLKHLA